MRQPGVKLQKALPGQSYYNGPAWLGTAGAV